MCRVPYAWSLAYMVLQHPLRSTPDLTLHTHLQGKGIFLVRQLSQVLEKLESDKAHCKPTSRPTPRIVQRCIPDVSATIA